MIEVMATMALAAVVAGIAVGLFSALVGPVVTWRARTTFASRAAVVADWLRGELSFAGGGPLPGRLAVAVDATGDLHLLAVLPPAVTVASAIRRTDACSDGTDPRSNPDCERDVRETPVTATFATSQWPLSIRSADAGEVVVASRTSPCPTPTDAPYLALVAVDRIAVVQPSAVRFDVTNLACIYTVAATRFPGTDPPGAAFVGGALVPVRWHTFHAAVNEGVLRASWNGAPPRRVQAASVGVTFAALPDEDIAVAQLAAVEVRFGEDTDSDGIVDAWASPAALPVARRDAVEVALVLSRPAGRALARSLTLPSGTVYRSSGGALLEPVVTRLTLGAVTR
jgi:hypothetical protein